MKCLHCSHELTAGRFPFVGDYRGTAVEFEAEGLRCSTCGFTTVKVSQAAEYSRAAADAYRKKHELLTSDEIRQARSQLGMSQAEFAEHVGVGIATIKRVEWSHAQDPATDAAIRSALNPAVLERAVFDGFWNLTNAGGAVELSAISDVASDCVRAAFAAYDAPSATWAEFAHQASDHCWLSVATFRAEFLTTAVQIRSASAEPDERVNTVAADTQLALA